MVRENDHRTSAVKSIEKHLKQSKKAIVREMLAKARRIRKKGTLSLPIGALIQNADSNSKTPKLKMFAVTNHPSSNGGSRVTKASMPSDKHFANTELLSSIQEVANFVASYFRSVSGELSLHQCEPVKTPCGKTRLSGRISYFETHSFTDSNRVAREFFLHLGFAALGSVRAVRTTASIRSKIWHQLRHALREGALSDDSPDPTLPGCWRPDCGCPD